MRFSRSALLLAALLWSAASQAMWAGMSDAELVKQSPLIVMATYLGSSQVMLPEAGQALHLGVLDVEDTLKGTRRELVFIQLPPANGLPQKSDDLFFRPGQKGLWFLKEDSQQQGLYKIDSPQRFIPEQQLAGRMATLRKLLAAPQGD